MFVPYLYVGLMSERG